MDEVARAEKGVRLRGADEADVAAIADLYGRLSDASFWTRFMQGRAGSAPARWAPFDTARGAVVVLAEFEDEPGTVVGEGRYVPTGDRVAEFALAVDDRAQGRGIGRVLLAELLRIANQRGLDRLSATVLAENTAMLRVADQFDFVLTEALDCGTVSLEVSTDEGTPGWPDDGRRHVLLEGRSWHDSPEIERLRAGAATVRRCFGPRLASFSGLRSSHQVCPLVGEGRCRLAEGADEIIDMLPAGVPACDAVLAEHRRRWPERLRPRADAHRQSRPVAPLLGAEV